MGCKDDSAERLAANKKDLEKKDAIFTAINNAWSFRTIQPQAKSQTLIANWEELRLLLLELNQKPKSTIGAFQKKSIDLTKKVDSVYNSIPSNLQIPEFKSRFLVLLNQFRTLELFITLDEIPQTKVIAVIEEINKQLASIEIQLDEFVRKSEVPMEQGESDMIRMLDTSRAAKNIPKNLEKID
jgi:uncharacterized membrane protein YgaE (UPF0421/DUF939 family)